MVGTQWCTRPDHRRERVRRWIVEYAAHSDECGRKYDGERDDDYGDTARSSQHRCPRSYSDQWLCGGGIFLHNRDVDKLTNRVFVSVEIGRSERRHEQ